MITIQNVLSRAFPLLALTGLLLAGWGLIVTPDEIQGNAQVGLWGERAPAALEGTTTTAWRD
jgi:hypothetical protein